MKNNKVSDWYKYASLFLFILIVLLVTLFYGNYQQRLKAGDGKGWDGKSYYEMYENFQYDERSEIQYPFGKRLGTPFLASLASKNAEKGFIIVNVISGIIALLMTYWLLCSYTRDIYLIYFCLLPLLFYLYSPIRFPFYHPFTVDPPAVALLATGAMLYVNKKYIIAVLVMLVSAIFRESGVYYSIVMLLFVLYDYYREHKYVKLCVLIVFYSFGMIIVYNLLNYFPYINEGGQIKTIVKMLLIRLSDPFGILRVMAGILMVVGPFMYKVNFRKIKVNEPYFIFLTMSLVMCALGGFDVTRIFYMGYPLYVLSLVPLIEKYNKVELLLLSIAGLIVNRFIARIPEPQNYMPNNDMKGWFTYTPDHAGIWIVTGIILYWVIVYNILDVKNKMAEN